MPALASCLLAILGLQQPLSLILTSRVPARGRTLSAREGLETRAAIRRHSGQKQAVHTRVNSPRQDPRWQASRKDEPRLINRKVKSWHGGHLDSQVNKLMRSLRASSPRGTTPILLRAAQEEEITSKAYSLLLQGLKRKAAWRQCLALVEHLQQHEPGKLKTPHVTIAIGACGKAKQWRQVLRLVDDLFDSSTLQPDLRAINTAIRGCASAGQRDEAVRLLREAIPRAGYAPDAYSYSAAITACANCADADGALGLFDEMRASGLPPNPVVHSATIVALQRGGRPRDALSLFERMQVADGTESSRRPASPSRLMASHSLQI